MSDKSFANIGEFIKAAYIATKTGMRDERLERKAAGMSEGIDADGGYIVNQQILGPVLNTAQQKSKVWDKCLKATATDRNNRTGVKVPILKQNDLRETSTSGKLIYWILEGLNKTKDYPELDQLDMRFHKIAVLIPVTDELMMDSSLLNDWIHGHVAKRLGYEVDRAILYGSPSTSMQGIMAAGAKGVVAAVEADPIDEATLANFEAAISPADMDGAEWYMSKENWNDLTANGATFMDKHELVIDGGEWYLYGHKVNVMGQMYGKQDLMLGDFSNYVVVTHGDSPEFASSIQFAFDSDQTYLRWVIRMNGASFGQKYFVDGGLEVAPFVVPTKSSPFESSSSNSSLSSLDITSLSTLSSQSSMGKSSLSSQSSMGKSSLSSQSSMGKSSASSPSSQSSLDITSLSTLTSQSSQTLTSESSQTLTSESSQTLTSESSQTLTSESSQSSLDITSQSSQSESSSSSHTYSSAEQCDNNYCASQFSKTALNGTYTYKGQQQGGKPAYSKADDSYYLFWDTTYALWAISKDLGDPPPQWESSQDVADICPDGVYANISGLVSEGAC